MIRVVLIDDHPALRMGLRIVLEQAPDVQVAAEAGSGQEALALIQALRPDVAVLDCQLPDMPGSQVAAELRRLGLATRVLALSAYSDDAAIRGMVEAGAVGYLLKEEAPAAIVEAVRAAARGEGRWSAAVASRLAAWAVRPAAGEAGTDLTSRELEVVRWLAQGWDNQRIAQELQISEHTVRFHLRNIRDKIGVQTRTEAAVWAVRRGLAED
ncbi:MAG: response regulator transcription factor [Anaerolinea sp.]|nr:response regulator transcription factor [Anaerolinea sp.]